MKTSQLVASIALLTLTLPSRSFCAENAATVTEDRVNVRGQPSLVGEVITQLQKGETVTVLEEISLEKPKPGDPARWAKIRMPANTPVWVFASFIDSNTKTVSARRLNLRAGPGENYSVVGRLERGDPVKPIRTVDEWMEIETPEKAYAFVAADLLGKTAGTAAPVAASAIKPDESAVKPDVAQSSPAPAAPSSSEPASDPTAPAKSAETKETPPLASTETPAQPAPAAPIQQPPATAAETTPASPTVVPVPPALEVVPQPAAPSESAAPKPADPIPAPGPSSASPSEPAPKRVVAREGIVRGTKSIQAPTHFELVSPDSRKVINYLYTEDGTLNLKDLKGKKILVRGEEGIDPRWPNIPLIIIESLEVSP